jgi:hypothetical protein
VVVAALLDLWYKLLLLLDKVKEEESAAFLSTIWRVACTFCGTQHLPYAYSLQFNRSMHPCTHFSRPANAFFLESVFLL